MTHFPLLPSAFWLGKGGCLGRLFCLLDSCSLLIRSPLLSRVHVLRSTLTPFLLILPALYSTLFPPSLLVCPFQLVFFLLTSPRGPRKKTRKLRLLGPGRSASRGSIDLLISAADTSSDREEKSDSRNFKKSRRVTPEGVVRESTAESRESSEPAKRQHIRRTG